MTADLTLAITHHLLVFAIFAIFAVQMALVRPGLGPGGIKRLVGLDAAYGAVAVAVIAAGFARAFWGLKGWEYYAGYWVFWAKLGVFLVVGLLSIRPTLRFRRWLSEARADPAWTASAQEVAAVRPWLHGEGFFLLLIPVLAAMLARGIAY